MTKRAGRRKPSVILASPVGQRTPGRTCAIRRHASTSSGPAARWMAPATPPQPSRASFAAFTIASTASAVMSPLRSSMRLTTLSAHGIRLEVRILDDAETIAERILHRADANALADVRYFLDGFRAELDQSIENLARIGDAPVGAYAVRARLRIRQQAELEASDGKADIERLVEIRLDAHRLDVPHLPPVELRPGS